MTNVKEVNVHVVEGNGKEVICKEGRDVCGCAKQSYQWDTFASECTIYTYLP